jgi:hypothetical protein
MSKQTPVIEWYTAQDDADWERLCVVPLSSMTPVANRHLHLKRHIWSLAALCLLLAGAGGWWWHTSQIAMHQATMEPTTRAQQERRVVAPGDGRLATGGDFRRTDTGWVQIAPDAALWGPERSLQTPYFIFHFRQNDAAAVVAVAPQIDALYTTMQRNLGLTTSPVGLASPFAGEKLVIEVSVTSQPGRAAFERRMYDRFVVPSPAVYWAPVEVTDAELLAQSITLPLFDHLLAQASQHYQMGPSWQALLNGLYLWLVWDVDLPLATWRDEVVRWIYVDLPAVGPGQPLVLPERSAALCAAHKLWLPSPVHMNIPLICASPEWEELYSWRLREPPMRLAQLAAPLRPEEYAFPPSAIVTIKPPHEGDAVALATLVDYAVTAFGRERLPALLAGLGQYESWDTLIPAVFGVSTAEFEMGWQAYLETHYGVAPAN